MLGKTLLLSAAIGLGYAIWRHLRTRVASSARATKEHPTQKTPTGDTQAASDEANAATQDQAHTATEIQPKSDIAADGAGKAPVAATSPTMREPAIIRRLWRELGAWLGTPPADRRHVIMCRTCGGPMIQTAHDSQGFSP